MRINAILASVISLAFGLTGFFALRALDGAVGRAGANTKQVVRVQQIYTDLLRADAATTNGFLQGGLEPAALRKTYDDAMARISTNIADAANAQPADGAALAALNDKVGTYATYVSQARTYNRQTLPVGAQYLTLASQQLRSDILPIVANLATANQDRAESGARGRASVAMRSRWVVGVLTLGRARLSSGGGWPKSTHRIVSLPLDGRTSPWSPEGSALTLSARWPRPRSTMSSVRDGDFTSAVNSRPRAGRPTTRSPTRA
jgi:hypothetical protein